MATRLQRIDTAQVKREKKNRGREKKRVEGERGYGAQWTSMRAFIAANRL